MKRSFWLKQRLLMLTAFAVPLFLGGCGGGGSDDTPGTTPTPTPVTASYSALSAEITKATVENGNLSVTFAVKDGKGQVVTDLTKSGFSFAVAQLLRDGTSAQHPYYWQSYINRLDAGAAAADAPGLSAEGKAKYKTAIQATTESNGTFVNNGDGTYTYTYNIKMLASTDPGYSATYYFAGKNPALVSAGGDLDYTFLGDAALEYRPANTHRVALQLTRNTYGTHAPINVVYDFIPATGNPINPATDPSRLVAETANCNNCHDGQLAFHGSSSRVEVSYCVTCHNPGSVDGNSGFSLDMANMIHKIHAGKTLPSVKAGGRYVIWGYNNSEHDYSEVTYPTLYYSNGRYTNAASPLNCSTCHTNSATTPQGNNWNSKVSDLACFSCHDQEVAGKLFIYNNRATYATHISTGIAFPADQSNLPKRNCGGCHAGTDTGLRRTINVHDPQFGTPKFRYSIDSVTVDGAGIPTVRFKVEMRERVASAWTALDLRQATALPSVTPDGSATATALTGGPNFALFYSTNGVDFNMNTGLSQPESDTLAALRTANAVTAFDPATGLNTAVLTKIFPSGSTLRSVMLQGYFTLGSTRLYAETPLKWVNTGVAGQRREVVKKEQCLDCHDVIAFHGGNRVNDPMVCAGCHNPRLSSSGHLITSTANSLGRAGLPQDEVTNNFKDMIHGIHAGTLVGGRNQGTGLYYDFSFMKDEYPARGSNCLKCHNEGTYMAPPTGALATVNNTYSRTATVADPNDLVTTPFSASCVGCHDSVEAKRHMENLGGRFKVQRSALSGVAAEACGTCHAAGRTQGVDVVHTGLK